VCACANEVMVSRSWSTYDGDQSTYRSGSAAERAAETKACTQGLLHRKAMDPAAPLTHPCYAIDKQTRNTKRVEAVHD
jgi:hypothetical protein